MISAAKLRKRLQGLLFSTVNCSHYLVTSTADAVVLLEDEMCGLSVQSGTCAVVLAEQVAAQEMSHVFGLVEVACKEGVRHHQPRTLGFDQAAAHGRLFLVEFLVVVEAVLMRRWLRIGLMRRLTWAPVAVADGRPRDPTPDV